MLHHKNHSWPIISRNHPHFEPSVSIQPVMVLFAYILSVITFLRETVDHLQASWNKGKPLK